MGRRVGEFWGGGSVLLFEAESRRRFLGLDGLGTWKSHFITEFLGLTRPSRWWMDGLALGEFTTSSDTKFDRQDAVAKPPIHEDGCRVYSI